MFDNPYSLLFLGAASLVGLYYLITPKIRDNPLEVITSDNTVIEELLSKLQLADSKILSLSKQLLLKTDEISQQVSMINRMHTALSNISQRCDAHEATIRAFENVEGNLNLVSIPSQGTLQDLYNLIYFKTQFHEFFYVQVSRLRVSNSEPWMLNIEGIEEHINMLETNLDPVLSHCQEFQYLLDKSSGFF